MDFFVSSLITSMRETLEALFVFITVFSIIRKSNQKKTVYLSPIIGAVLGVVVAISAGVGVHYLGNDFSHTLWFKIIFDTLMLASTIWFILWMIFEGKTHEHKVKNEMLNTSSIALTSFLMVFISFFREGMETVAFTFDQASSWGIFTGCMIAIVVAVFIYISFKFLNVKYLMLVLMILLIMATSTIVGKFADDLIYKGDIIYRIPNDSTGMQVLNSFLRGFFGIKTSSTALALALQLSWDVILITLVVWREFKYVPRS